MKPFCMKNALLLSLVINLFCFGYFVSMHVRAKSEPSATITVFRQAIRQISPQGQEAFRDAFIGNGGLILETKSAMAEKRLAVLKKIGDPDLDMKELETLMAETADLTHATQKGMQALLLQAISGLSAEDRKKLSDYLVKQKESRPDVSILGDPK